MKYRINGFDQIKAFYSVVFDQKYEIKPQHISLYVFLINQNNRNNWVEWFKCPFDLGMAGACIGNKKTYYKCLDDLQEWEFIKYEKGVNNWKAPKIKIEVLKCTATDTATVPQSEPLVQPIPEQALKPLPTHIYKLITNNLKPITNNYKGFEKYIISLSDEKFNFKKSLINLGVEKQIIEDWLKVRKSKKSSNTETAFKAIKLQIEKSKLNANECIKIAVEKSWSGFNADWVKDHDKSHSLETKKDPSLKRFKVKSRMGETMEFECKTADEAKQKYHDYCGAFIQDIKVL